MWADYYYIRKMIDHSIDKYENVSFDKKSPMALLKNKVMKELRKRNCEPATATELNFIVQKAKKHGKLIFKPLRYVGGYSIL